MHFVVEKIWRRAGIGHSTFSFRRKIFFKNEKKCTFFLNFSQYSRYRSRSRERRRIHSPDAGRQSRGDRDRGGRQKSPAEKYSSRQSRSRSRSKSFERERRRSGSRSPRRTNGHSDLRSTSRPKCLGVFGLSIFTTEKQIYSIFEKFGPLDRVQVIIDSKVRGFNFFVFADHYSKM